MSAKKIHPTGNRILVLPIPVPDTTAGGIALPAAWKQASGMARVLAVGIEQKNVKPGDRVLFSWINGVEVEMNGEKCKILRDDEILAVME